MEETIVVILAGGLSRRMGRDKAQVELGGVPLLERQVRAWSGQFPAVYVSVDRPGRFDTYGAGELCDLRPGNQGPLAGLEAAFLGTGAERVFLTAVDLPFAQPELAGLVLDALEDHAACCLRWPDGRLEPLFAAYHRSCLAVVQACLEEGRRSFHALLERVDCRYLAPQQLPGAALEQMLFNVNTPEQLRQAEGKI